MIPRGRRCGSGSDGQVDAELRQTMAEKVKIIEHIVEGTQLVLEAGALQIFGGLDEDSVRDYE